MFCLNGLSAARSACQLIAAIIVKMSRRNRKITRRTMKTDELNFPWSRTSISSQMVQCSAKMGA